MRMVGCLVLLLAIAALCGEVWLALVIAHHTDLLAVILVTFAISIIGVKVVKHHVTRLPVDMMGGRLGHRAVAIIGGALLVFPGFVTDVIGLVLLLPFARGWFAGGAAKVAQAALRQAMSRMGGTNGFPSMPGGFPFPMKPGAFPGMPGAFPRGVDIPGMMPKGGFQPLKPDEIAKFGAPPLPPKGKAPRTYDTTAEDGER